MDIRGAVLWLFVITATAHAQETLKPTEVTDSPVDDLGSRRTTRPTETIPQTELKTDQRPLEDALNLLPGVQARVGQGSPTLSIRGSQSSGRTLVMTDGAPLNFADGIGFNPIFLATENIDHVLLLRGPSSSLFGHDALAGALEFDTEKLERPKFFESYGSFNTTQTFAAVPFKILSADTQVTAYQTFSDGNFPYSSPRTGYSGTRVRNDQETLRATVSSQHETENIKWKTYNLVARQIGSTPDALPTPFPSAYNNWAELNYLGGSINLGDHLKLGSRSTFKYLNQSYAGSTPLTSEGVRQGLSVIKTIGTHEIEIFDDFSFEQFNASYLVGGSANQTLNEYGAADFFPLAENLNLQPAIRFSSENGGVIPSIGLVGTLFEKIKYFANYSQGYHPPSLTQMYESFPSFGAGSSAQQGNPNLSAELSTEYDLGVETTFKDLTLHLEAFQRDIYNLIEPESVTAAVISPENVGHAHATGLEFSAKLANPVQTGINVSLLSNTLSGSNDPIPLSPTFQGSVYVAKKISVVTTTLQDTYWSNYQDINFNTTPSSFTTLYSWNTVDLFFATTISKEISVKVAALNIFNQPRELTLGYPEAQRSFSLMLQGYL